MGALALTSILSGCGKRQPHPTPEQEMNAVMEANSPFGAAEIRMDDAMARAVGADVGDSWVRKMIEHHKGAIAIARETLALNPDANVAGMARATIDGQTREIADLQRLLVKGSPDPASADLYQPTMDKMHQAMMAATGTSLSQTFHRKMLEHNKGAVAMADVALANGVTGAVRAEVEKSRADHLKQAERIERMLRNEADARAQGGSATLDRANKAAAAKSAT
ncbi:MAG: DUF305 domain-containing protein [Pseudomonadota bacterium]